MQFYKLLTQLDAAKFTVAPDGEFAQHVQSSVASEPF